MVYQTWGLCETIVSMQKFEIRHVLLKRYYRKYSVLVRSSHFDISVEPV